MRGRPRRSRLPSDSRGHRGMAPAAASGATISDMPKIMASVFTDHLAAWGTAASAVGTVATLTFLVIQLAIDRAAQRQRLKRDQAESVSAWFGSEWLHHDPDRTTQRIELLNASRQPVYQMVALLVGFRGVGAPEPDRTVPAKDQYGGYYMQTLSVLPPGTHYTTVPAPPMVMFRRYGVELAYTDRAGVHCRRSADGGLTQIKSPRDYYEVPLPHNWLTPEELRPAGGTDG
jgi:hypothetical protein